MDDKIWYLEEVNLFKIICPHYYADYKESHEFDSYSKKEFIYFTDEPSTKVYLIDKGRVKIAYYTEEGEEVVKAILSKGEIFGEKTILGETKHNEFAQSLDKETSICSISTNELEGLMLENRNLSLKLYKFIGLRLKRLERRLEIILFKDVRQRTIEFIQELNEDYGKRLLNEEILIKHPYSQKDIASLIGTSRPSLNIVLNNLKEEGILSFSGKEIILKNSKVLDS
ncbi:MAG: Crp/Fnr family transcriptional regulator [Lutibacter sp.]|uniref:Crp/Fnr family transcriptional regulator n=1 Tax=Lutibacter sp. TaxID=1925666 RepID=UPI00385C7399